MRTKLVGGHKATFIVFFFVSFFLYCSCHASKILDFETENFIQHLIDKIRIENNISKNINFVILSDDRINAFVDQNNVIYITSGLIKNCEDYVALFSVLAHEIGHIDKNHIKQRKLNIKKLNKINNFSNLSIIAGSLISNNPDILQSIAVSTASTSDLKIIFNKDQEREADYYSLNTLKKLNLFSDSIIKLLNTIDQKNSSGENKINHSHPYFEERIDVINFLNNNKNNSFKNQTNNQFKFIQAKFLGYENEINQINQLDYPYKLYANAILKARSGNLKSSLEDLNKLIKENNKNIYFIETKAEILFSFGYINEAVKFYQFVTSQIPNNFYAQIRIFENINFEELSSAEIDKLFYTNLNLIEKFYNNKNILNTYLKLSEFSKKTEWVNFLNYWINENDSKEDIKNNLKNFKKTKDNDLSRLVNLIYNNI